MKRSESVTVFGIQTNNNMVHTNIHQSLMKHNYSHQQIYFDTYYPLL